MLLNGPVQAADVVCKCDSVWILELFRMGGIMSRINLGQG